MVNQNKPLHEINQKIRTCKGNYLLIADENWTLFDWSLLTNSRSEGSLIISNRYDIYQKVEIKVRKAIELDNRLDILAERGLKSEVTKMRFRVRQLTGLTDVETRINELI